MNIFENASRRKLRFAVTKGVVAVEDLWEYNLEDLDIIYKRLNKQIKEAEEESYIVKKSTAGVVLTLQIDIIKHIIDSKMEEVAKRKLAKERSDKRSLLIELIGKKEISALESKSVDELLVELKALDEV